MDNDTQSSFTDQVWQEIEPIRAAIDRLPFVRELEAGTLSTERFEYYLGQDATYLAGYAAALATAAAQADEPDALMFWARSAHDCIAVERELHGSHVDVLTGVSASPTCAGYVSYLHSLGAAGCYPALAAGVLPCFWIYDDVGSRMRTRLGELTGHPFADWIGTYGDPEFAASAATARRMVDDLASRSSAPVVERMRTAFITASRYEWMFWDAAYRLESWPV